MSSNETQTRTDADNWLAGPAVQVSVDGTVLGFIPPPPGADCSFTVVADAFYVDGHKVELPVDRHAHASGDKPHNLLGLLARGLKRLRVALRQAALNVLHHVGIKRRNPVRDPGLISRAQ